MNKKHTMDWRGLCPITQRPHPRLTPQDFQPCITAYYAAISSPLKLAKRRNYGHLCSFCLCRKVVKEEQQTVGDIDFAHSRVEIEAQQVEVGIEIVEFLLHALGYNMIGDAAKWL